MVCISPPPNTHTHIWIYVDLHCAHAKKAPAWPIAPHIEFHLLGNWFFSSPRALKARAVTSEKSIKSGDELTYSGCNPCCLISLGLFKWTSRAYYKLITVGRYWFKKAARTVLWSDGDEANKPHWEYVHTSIFNTFISQSSRWITGRFVLLVDVEDCPSQTMRPYNHLPFFLSLSSRLNQRWAWHPVRQHPSRLVSPRVSRMSDKSGGETGGTRQTISAVPRHVSWKHQPVSRLGNLTGCWHEKKHTAPRKKERAVWQVIVVK